MHRSLGLNKDKQPQIESCLSYNSDRIYQYMDLILIAWDLKMPLHKHILLLLFYAFFFCRGTEGHVQGRKR